MTGGPQIGWLPDGERLHLHHGPIDIIFAADGPDRDRAFLQAANRFDTLLDSLVGELHALRRPLDRHAFRDPVARRMAAAVAPFDGFVTPMAAVAGAVADELLEAACQSCRLFKAYMNNGGDIAFHIAGDAVFRAAGPAGDIELGADAPSRGVATSGWQGRSHSLGIADAVTVAARTAATADVAATLIANAVDLPGHPAIARTPASDLSPDSDLGDQPVTTEVGPLTEDEITTALDRGLALAERFRAAGLIDDAALALRGAVRTTYHPKGPLHGRLSHPQDAADPRRGAP